MTTVRARRDTGRFGEHSQSGAERGLAAMLLLLVFTFACSGNKPAPPADVPGAGADAAVSSGGDDAAAAPDANTTIGPIDAGIGGPPPPLTDNVTLYVVGDSTAAIFPPTDPTARVGWAAVLQQFFTDGVTVYDAAKSGRSSKSFIDEGFWSSVVNLVKPGDYVFIQFGHNDEKVGDVPRYTNPATSFREYLKIYIRDTRQAGGFAVLLTPISRRQFAGTAISPTHGAYPGAVIAVGQETNTPVIDMTERTRVFLEALGPAATIPLFAVGDNTHLSALGAPEIAKLAVQGIRDLDLPLVARLAPP